LDASEDIATDNVAEFTGVVVEAGGVEGVEGCEAGECEGRVVQFARRRGRRRRGRGRGRGCHYKQETSACLSTVSFYYNYYARVRIDGPSVAVVEP
jgi:hypothetical protein